MHNVFGEMRQAQINEVARQKELNLHSMPLLEKIGARTMSAVGVVTDFFSTEEDTGNISTLRRHAYLDRQRLRTARNIWGIISLTFAALTSGAIYDVAPKIDNILACSGAQTVEINSGDTISGKIEELQIPHHNTPLQIVIDDVAARNEQLVSRDSSADGLNPNSVRSGVADFPLECNSLLP